MNPLGSPLKETQRLEWIDAARGFAIFGILIVNTPAFNAPFFLYGGETMYWTSGIDRIIQAVIDIFFQASFYTLFSFLFGFGIQMMVDRLRDKQLPYETIIFRRLLILIGFGLFHAFLIWHGDILLSYGLIGMLLFFFFRSQSSTLVYWGIGLLGGSALLLTGLLYSARNIGEQVNRQAINQAFTNYGEGSLIDIWQQNYQDWVYANGGLGFIFLIANLLPLFLFGMYTARKRWLHEPAVHLSLLKKAWLIALVVFILFKAGPYAVGNPFWFSYTQDNIGGAASAVFYLLSITLLYHHGSTLMRPFTYVGRMALTNYLLQSVISFFLYYSVGLGLYGSVRPVWSILIAVSIFSLQIPASVWWLRRFRFGPAEWLWRSLTYGKRQPWKAAPEKKSGGKQNEQRKN